MQKQLKETIERIPQKAGVYKFINSDNEVIYVGKAVRLKSRVSSYFSQKHQDRPRIELMIPEISKIDVIETENELEALVLESALIKQFKPHFNTDLKDDKSYSWLYINTQDRYPTVKIVRNPEFDRYKKGKLFGPYPSGKAIQRVFTYLRKIYPFCTSKDPTSACFHYHIGLCPGPDATNLQYRQNINGIVRFLNGRSTQHLEILERKMRVHAKASEFEKAAVLRDKIDDLKYLGSSFNDSYFNSEQQYIQNREERIKESLSLLCEQLNIPFAQRIECYDISNLKGKMAYGSMVVAINGISQNSLYRVFKIKEIDTPNDPQMLLEVLKRRLKYLESNKDESLCQRPQIILIDGAKSQLSTVKDIIPPDINLLGISKGKRFKRSGGKKKDEFWIVRKDIVFPITLKNTVILTNLRDESHRFALYHHRKLRKFTQKKSILDEISGIGPKRKKELIKKFESVKGMAKASIEDIDNVIKNKKVAQKLLDVLKTSMNS